MSGLEFRISPTGDVRDDGSGSQSRLSASQMISPTGAALCSPDEDVAEALRASESDAARAGRSDCAEA